MDPTIPTNNNNEIKKVYTEKYEYKELPKSKTSD